MGRNANFSLTHPALGPTKATISRLGDDLPFCPIYVEIVCPVNVSQEGDINEIGTYKPFCRYCTRPKKLLPYAHHGKPHSSYNLSRFITAEIDPLKINFVVITAFE